MIYISLFKRGFNNNKSFFERLEGGSYVLTTYPYPEIPKYATEVTSIKIINLLKQYKLEQC